VAVEIETTEKKWSWLTWILFILVGGVSGMVILLAIRGFKRWRKWRLERRKDKVLVETKPDEEVVVEINKPPKEAPSWLEAL
jgi:hypothetical protein